MNVLFWAALCLFWGAAYVVVGSICARLADRLIHGEWRSYHPDTEHDDMYYVLAWPILIPLLLLVNAGIYLYEKVTDLFG